MPAATMPDYCNTVIIAAIVPIALYSLVLIVVLVLVSSKKSVGLKSKASGRPSIIIPFRNEGAGILRKFAQITASGLSLKSHVVFVDDHSTDVDQDELEKLLPPESKLLTLPEGTQGKKQAIAYAMQYVDSEWVLTNDTDATISTELLGCAPDRLSTAKLFILPIKPLASKSIASKLFAIEFTILQAVGLAFAKMRQPVLANGAGLLINRKAFLDTMESRTDWVIAGGDDIFTMLAIRKAFGPRSVDAFVTDKPLIEASFHESFAKLWEQRIRWVAKVPSVKQLRFAVLAWIVLVINVLTLGIVVHALINGITTLTLVFLALKWIPEMALAAWGVLYFRRPDCAIWIIPALVFYPLYLPALIVTSVFWTPSWK